MTDRTPPRTIKDPWADSVRHKEQQGSLRDSNGSKKLKSEKESRRRDDRSAEREQGEEPERR